MIRDGVVRRCAEQVDGILVELDRGELISDCGVIRAVDEGDVDLVLSQEFEGVVGAFIGIRWFRWEAR